MCQQKTRRLIKHTSWTSGKALVSLPELGPYFSKVSLISSSPWEQVGGILLQYTTVHSRLGLTRFQIHTDGILVACSVLAGFPRWSSSLSRDDFVEESFGPLIFPSCFFRKHCKHCKRQLCNRDSEDTGCFGQSRSRDISSIR